MGLFYKLLTIKRLFLFILITGGFPAIYFANYAMIFHWKATIISFIGVGFSVYGLFLHHWASGFSEKGAISKFEKWLFGSRNPSVNSAEKIAWTGLAIYTLNLYWIVFILIIGELVYNNRFIKVKNSGDKIPDSIEQNSGSTTPLPQWISFFYVLYDSYRQYTVWHEVQLRLIPVTVFIIFLSLFVYKKNQKGIS